MFHDVLNGIIENKKQEVVELEKMEGFELRKEMSTGIFQKSLETDGLSVIAEVKRRSPSAGTIGEIKKPSALVEKYIEGGASAISVLTDAKSFGGSLQDLEEVVSAIGEKEVAVLRKDFIIHPLQLLESASSSTTAVLLIVAILGKETRKMLEMARSLGLETLVEVHDMEELEIALDAGATVVGVNSRNLKTFEVSLSNAEKVLKEIPGAVIKVAESGIRSLDDAKRMRGAGCDAVLIGEGLVKSEDPIAFLQDLRGIE